MNKEEVTKIGFKIIISAGKAKSKLLNAMNHAQKGEFDESKRLISEANEKLNKAHNTQTELLTKFAGGEEIELNLIITHAQDHLMTVILLKNLIKHIIELYKRNKNI